MIQMQGNIEFAVDRYYEMVREAEWWALNQHRVVPVPADERWYRKAIHGLGARWVRVGQWLQALDAQPVPAEQVAR